MIVLDKDISDLMNRTARIQHVAEGDGWLWFDSAGAQTGTSKRDVRQQMANAMKTVVRLDDLVPWLGNYGAACTSTPFKRELRDRAARNETVPFPCGPEHHGGQIESKALALVTGYSVFVLTPGHPTGLKFSPKASAPRSTSIYVASMGPRGRGDAKVDTKDIILTYNGTDHYNAPVALHG